MAGGIGSSQSGGRARRASDTFPLAYVGLTDWGWFDLLRSMADLDEVNFWQPSAGTGFAALRPGEPLLFKLHRPRDLIAGFGYFGRYTRLPISLAWSAFGLKNGVASLAEMRRRVELYRRTSPSGLEDYEVGCIMLEQPVFLDESDWLDAPDWKSNIQRGRTYRLDEQPGQALWRELELRSFASRVAAGDVAGQLREPGAARYGSPSFVRPRLGQGTFQGAVIDAYRRRCAISGEKVLPVLQAAHIKPYAEGGEHRVDNGLLLRSDLHTLFDRGYLTVTPRYGVLVSQRLRADFNNGDAYLALSGTQIQLPDSRDERPNGEFLSWHNEARFVA